MIVLDSHGPYRWETLPATDPDDLKQFLKHLKKCGADFKIKEDRKGCIIKFTRD